MENNFDNKEYIQKLDEVFEYMKEKRFFSMTLHAVKIPQKYNQRIYDALLMSDLLDLRKGYGKWQYSFLLNDKGRIKLGKRKYSKYKIRKVAINFFDNYRSDIISVGALILSIIAITKS